MISRYFRHKIAEEDSQEFARKVLDETNARRVWPVWHRTCGDIAFFMLKDPRTTNIRSRDVLLFNGARPPANSPMICESCGQAIEKLDLLAEQPQRFAHVFMGDLRCKNSSNHRLPPDQTFTSRSRSAIENRSMIFLPQRLFEKN